MNLFVNLCYQRSDILTPSPRLGLGSNLSISTLSLLKLITKNVVKYTGEATDQDTLAPDFLTHPPTPDFLGKVGLNLALGVTSCCGHQTA